MNNNNENVKARECISIAVGTDALLRFIEEIRGAQASNEPKQQVNLDKYKPYVHEDDDLSLCCGEDEPVCVTVATGCGNTHTVQIKACPSYYIVYEICQDGAKGRLFKGKRGTIYGLMKRIAEESRKA